MYVQQQEQKSMYYLIRARIHTYTITSILDVTYMGTCRHTTLRVSRCQGATRVVNSFLGQTETRGTARDAETERTERQTRQTADVTGTYLRGWYSVLHTPAHRSQPSRERCGPGLGRAKATRRRKSVLQGWASITDSERLTCTADSCRSPGLLHFDLYWAGPFASSGAVM